MGRFSRISQEENDETKVDISPLIDCVFILLIFFIVTTTFVEEQGVALEKSQAGSSNSDASEDEPVIFILPGGKTIQANGVKIGIGEVRKIVKNKLKDPEKPVTIKAAKDVPVSLLTQVRDQSSLGGAEIIQYAEYRGGR